MGEDRLVADWCLERSLPLLFVGEPRGGVTGSPSFWSGRARPVLASEVSAAFVDVPNWQGAHDRTWCIRPGLDENGCGSGATDALAGCSAAAEGSFIESSFRTKVEYEASLLLPSKERERAERAAAARWS